MCRRRFVAWPARKPRHDPWDSDGRLRAAVLLGRNVPAAPQVLAPTDGLRYLRPPKTYRPLAQLVRAPP